MKLSKAKNERCPSPASSVAPTSISASELSKALEEGGQKIELIDVRALKEHRAMRLKGSRLIPLPDLFERVGELAQADNQTDGQTDDHTDDHTDGQTDDRTDNQTRDRTDDRIIVVYCRSGIRSRKACSILRTCGFADVRNLTGGILAWYREFEEKMIESDAHF